VSLNRTQESLKVDEEVKMKKGMTMAVIFSVLILFAASSLAQPQQRLMRAKRTFDRSPNPILAVLKANQEELSITDEQIKQIQNLIFSHQEKAIQMKNENALQRLELQKLLQDRENLDYEKIKSVLSQSSAVRQEMFIQRLEQREEINKILTPEQQEALKALTMERMREGFPPMRLMRDRMQRFPRFRDRIRR
jgi:Spy/CpxP family protein refolding chaperone